MTTGTRWMAAAVMTMALTAGGEARSGARAQEPAASRPALGGVWQLNRELSTPAGGGPGVDTGRRGSGLGGGMGGGRGGGMGGPGGRGGGMGGPGGGGRGGPGGGAPNEEAMQAMRDTMHELLQPATRLTIVQHDDTVSFTDDQGHVRKFVANGKDEKHQLQSATLETKSAWKDGKLVIQWETGRGPTVVRSYRVDAELHRLVVETSMKGGRGAGGGDRPPVTHVYDAVTDARP